MTFWQFVNQWWNLPYLVMLGLVGVFVAVQALGFAAHAGGAHEIDLDGDGVPDAVDLDGDGVPDHPVDPDIDHDLDHEAGLAGFLGVGRVPFMVVWLTLFIFTGFTGLFVNRVLQVKAGGYAPWFFPLSLLTSLATGAVAVRFTARAVHRLVDTGGRGASRKQELAGAAGVVASPVLDSHFGEVRVRDPRGNELIVHGHLGEGELPLKQGDKVVLVELKQDSGLFLVAALEE